MTIFQADFSLSYAAVHCRRTPDDRLATVTSARHPPPSGNSAQVGTGRSKCPLLARRPANVSDRLRASPRAIDDIPLAPRRCTSKCRHQPNLRLYNTSDQCSMNVITLQHTFVAIHCPESRFQWANPIQSRPLSLRTLGAVECVGGSATAHSRTLRRGSPQHIIPLGPVQRALSSLFTLAPFNQAWLLDHRVRIRVHWRSYSVQLVLKCLPYTRQAVTACIRDHPSSIYVRSWLPSFHSTRFPLAFDLSHPLLALS